MILVDTSVWVDHLRGTERRLVELLERGAVLVHPMVIGELACGNLHGRAEVLRLLRALPHAVEATHEEVLALIERYKLAGQGLGFIDMHLLASACLSEVPLLTRDRRLARAAQGLGCGGAVTKQNTRG